MNFHVAHQTHFRTILLPHRTSHQVADVITPSWQFHAVSERHLHLQPHQLPRIIHRIGRSKMKYCLSPAAMR